MSALANHFRKQSANALTREMREARHRGADIGSIEGHRAKGWTPARETPADTASLSRRQRRALDRRATKDGREVSP